MRQLNKINKLDKIKTNTIKAVFFDLDGTLFDTSQDLLFALNYLLEKHGYKTISFEQLLPYVSKGSREIINNILQTTISDQQLEIYKNEFITAYHQLGHKHAKFYPGIEKIINLLNTKNIPWGIITNKTEKLTLPLISLFKLNQLQCKTIVCADTTAHAKPHRDPMLKACSDTNIDPENYENCIFVGDAKTDIIAGKELNMLTIAASYGYIPPTEDVHTWGADLVIKSPLELLELLNNLE